MLVSCRWQLVTEPSGVSMYKMWHSFSTPIWLADSVSDWRTQSIVTAAAAVLEGVSHLRGPCQRSVRLPAAVCS